MKTNRNRRRLAFAAAVGLAVVLAAVAGLSASRPTTMPLPPEQIDASEPIPPSTTSAGAPPVIEPLPNGEAFALSVAASVFNWDTQAENREAVVAGVLAISDADEANGLVLDLDAYLPSASDWASLRDLGTRQKFIVDLITVPASWSRIAADNADRVTPGTVAYTFSGILHREGQWNGQAEVFDEPLTFTAFIACKDGDSGGRCVLLRLSALNKPLL